MFFHRLLRMLFHRLFTLGNLLTLPVLALELVSFCAGCRLLTTSSYQWRNDNYQDLRNLTWYLVHILITTGQQLIWGFPLLKGARAYPRCKTFLFSYLASCVIGGVVTAVPLLSLSKQKQVMGFGVYSTSFLYIVSSTLFLAYLLVHAGRARAPTSFYDKILWRSYMGKLDAFQWFSSFQLATFWPRILLRDMPVLNGLCSWIILLWHFAVAFYIGSHKPRWEAARCNEEKRD